VRRFLIANLLLIFVVGAVAAEARGSKRLVDTSDYKEGDFVKGVIEDYSDMVEGDDIEWIYVAPGVKLSDYSFKIGKFKNMSDVTNKEMVTTLEEGFDAAFQRLGKKGSKGTLTTENAIYWAERAQRGKRWIPYAGFHLAQSGVGIEMVFRDSKGKVIAKVRHSGRQGEKLEEAAEELVDDIANFIAKH
jgi:hypothetical protein